jgi:hypothetical protein
MTTETNEKITYYLLTAIWSTLDLVSSYILLAIAYGAKLRGFLLG